MACFKGGEILLSGCNLLKTMLQRWPRIGPVQTDNVILPIIYTVSYLISISYYSDLAQYSASLSFGVTSYVTSAVLVGIISQFWLRNYHPGWFRKYNYILGAALDAGSQVMTFILSFTVFGALGQARPFPAVSFSISCLPWLSEWIHPL